MLVGSEIPRFGGSARQAAFRETLIAGRGGYWAEGRSAGGCKYVKAQYQGGRSWIVKEVKNAALQQYISCAWICITRQPSHHTAARDSNSVECLPSYYDRQRPSAS